MKKSTLLTVASVGAVALTSAMTFAAWDNLEATTESTVTFTQVDVTQDQALTLKKDSGRALGSIPTATGTMAVKIEDNGNEFTAADTELKIVPDLSGPGITNSDFDVTVYSGTGESKTLLTDGIDDTPTFGATAETYTVVVTPKDASKTTIVDNEVTVKLTSTLSAKAGS